MKTRNKAKRLPLYLSLIAVSWAFSACGSNPYYESSLQEEGTVPGASTGNGGSNTSNNNTNTGGGSTNTGGSSTTTDPNLLPALSYSFWVTGSRGPNPIHDRLAFQKAVNTDNILKVKITALAAGSQSLISSYLPQPSSYTASYYCVTYTVTVLGESITTDTLSPFANVNCPSRAGANAATPQSQVLDFSARLQPGHGPVTVEVRANQYDADFIKCFSASYLGYFNPYGAFGCSSYYMNNVYQYHVVQGKLQIQVNGTTL